MIKYTKPYIEVLLFDEEEITMVSTVSTGFDATKAVTYMMGDDAGLDESPNQNVSITTVKVTALE